MAGYSSYVTQAPVANTYGADTTNAGNDTLYNNRIAAINTYQTLGTTPIERGQAPAVTPQAAQTLISAINADYTANEAGYKANGYMATIPTYADQLAPAPAPINGTDLLTNKQTGQGGVNISTDFGADQGEGSATQLTFQGLPGTWAPAPGGGFMRVDLQPYAAVTGTGSTGAILNPSDGSWSYPDGSIKYPDGSITYGNGTTVSASGVTTYSTAVLQASQIANMQPEQNSGVNSVTPVALPTNSTIQNGVPIPNAPTIKGGVANAIPNVTSLSQNAGGLATLVSSAQQAGISTLVGGS